MIKPDIFLVRVVDKPMSVFKRIGANHHPMNLLCLATWLKQHGHHPEIIDMEVEPLKYLEERLRSIRPRLVGITAMTPNMPDAEMVCRMCSSMGIQTVLGGPHPTALPGGTLKDAGCTYVVMGEGEKPLCMLLDNIKKNIPPDNIEGLAFLRDGQLFVNKRPQLLDVDDLPVPDRRLLKLDKYSGKVTPAVPDNGTTIFISRGCPYACTFCASKIINQQKIRFRSMKKVFEEIDDVVSLGFNHINVEDDIFTLDARRVEEFCSYLIEKYPRISWDCDSRVDGINEKVIGVMKKSNCRKISFGVESGSPRVLKSVNKEIDIKQIKEAFRLARKYKILTQALFMVGFPQETAEDVKATEKLIKEIEPDLLQVATVVPFPGTLLYEEMQSKGFLSSRDWGAFNFFGEKIPWHTRHFSSEDLVRIRKKISQKFYFSPSYIFRRIASVRSIDDLVYLAKGGLVALKAFCG